MFSRDDPPIPWVIASYQDNYSAPDRIKWWVGHARWRHWSCTAFDRRRNLARLKALWKVFLYRLIGSNLDPNKLTPRWYMRIGG